MVLGLIWAETALATEITHEGLTFSDEGGGFTLSPEALLGASFALGR